jgi:hypothetical protein
MPKYEMTEAQKAEMEKIPSSARKTYREACEGSKSQAVKAQCQVCSGYERKTVAECTAEKCPLWNVRPYQAKATDPNKPKKQLSQAHLDKLAEGRKKAAKKRAEKKAAEIAGNLEKMF